jgi:uncharacterized protein Veg
LDVSVARQDEIDVTERKLVATVGGQIKLKEDGGRRMKYRSITYLINFKEASGKHNIVFSAPNGARELCSSTKRY